MRVMSVRPSISFRQNRLRSENGKGMMGCGSLMGLPWGWLGVRGRERGDTKNMLFGRPCGVYVYYFKDICQGGVTV